MKTLLLLSFLVLTNLCAYAHLGSISGVVKDQATNLPLKGVTVQLSGQGKTTVTNELGQYRLEGLVASKYKVELSYVGFKSLVLEVSVLDDKTEFVKTLLSNADVELSEVVVSAQRAHDQQLINGVDIKLRPINNSQEILRMVPGLFIGQHAGGGKAEQIFLRGFDLDHGTDIRLTVDGMPVNMVSHAHGQGYADLHFVIPELVQGVDFKKGPYTTDKGNFTTAGWANFRTKDALDKSFVKLEAGQYDSFRAVAGVDLLGQKGRDKSQSAYIASEYSFTNSYFDNPQNFNRLNIVGKYHGHVAPNTNLTLTGSTFWSKWNHSGQIPDRAIESGMIGFYGSVDPTEGGETSRTNFNAQLVTVTPSNYVIKNQFYYSNYNFELYSNFTFFLEDSLYGDQMRQKEKRNLFGYNGSISKQHYFGKSSWTTTLGIQYRHDLTNRTELSHTVNRSLTLDPYKLGNVNELNASFYADELILVNDRFTVNAGLRLDYFRNQYEDLLANPVNTRRANDAILSPKLNLYYTFNPRVQLYLNTGKGFHSNDTRVVVPQGGKQILPGAYGSDLGVIFKPFPKMLINVAAWYLWMQQEFVYVGDAGVIEPSGKSKRQGLDLSVRYQITKTLYADMDVSSAKPRAIGELEGMNYLPLAPLFTSTGGLSLQMSNGLSGSLRYRYLANRPANEDNSIVAKGYVVADAQINYAKKRYNVGLSLQNLLNTKWKETQFATLSRLKNEIEPVEEIHFTPGTPFFAKLSLTLFF
ncbi:TonB-dependent receptor [Dyadobacter arcticus]|uniref:Outer membrane receptor protein involved in Fe transport n=1 Tax=Dyadobacter arcticus TaxID=1078754 RepID=A0ABX0UID3_9BACT|nr:TonB-dependent receptor [Dyadobacter arcticus]NIJ51789.1 outer membrane receptor protein involved in Fe transport [Dyadobacter arcticus]